MAPSQRGLGVMIKRGGNRRTARLNAPGVYINIENVISCEPRQLASEVPMSKTAGLVGAPSGSPWFKALDSRDCKQLMTLLQENPCLLVQKGDGGRTVLHAAAERGCLKLLDQVFDLFDGNDHFKDEREEIHLPLCELIEAEHIYAEDEEGTGLTAWEYAWWSIGDCVARQYLRYSGRRYGARFVSNQSEIFNSSIAGPVEEGSLPPRALLLEVLADHRSLLSDRMRSEFEEVGDYNFVADFEELRFHHACAHFRHDEDYRKYVEAVIGGCERKGAEVLRYLFQLRNAQGQTPLHTGMYSADTLVPLIPGQESGENAECLNMRDCRGWTALHHLTGFECAFEDLIVALLADGRVDVNATVDAGWEPTEATALHLAVLANNSKAAELLLKDPRTDVNALFQRRMWLDNNLNVSPADLSRWTALQLATVSGLPEMVKILIACPKVEDVGKRGKHGDCGKVSAIHLAAALGDPETLRLFITNQQYDPLVTCQGSTSLHFAVASSHPTCHSQWELDYPNLFNFVMRMGDFVKSYLYRASKMKGPKSTSYIGREACISILVQAGVDVWQKDDAGNFPEPGRSASIENHLSWQQKVAHETLEAKKSLNDAGNAISVVAALVATASYVGPLQPPLSYANDVVQTSNLLVRIFMVSNSVSFYLAIASIMFAVVPSLPMPQEGIYEEWQRTRQSIEVAISLLLMSVLGVLISFAAASNAVVSEEYSWRNGGLVFYPVVFGSLVCLLGITWFFIRLLRLIFPKSVTIRHLYQSLSQLKRKLR